MEMLTHIRQVAFFVVLTLLFKLFTPTSCGLGKQHAPIHSYCCLSAGCTVLLFVFDVPLASLRLVIVPLDLWGRTMCHKIMYSSAIIVMSLFNSYRLFYFTPLTFIAVEGRCFHCQQHSWLLKECCGHMVQLSLLLDLHRHFRELSQRSTISFPFNFNYIFYNYESLLSKELSDEGAIQ